MRIFANYSEDMKKFRTATTLLLALALLFAAGCKKDDPITSFDSMLGTIRLPFPRFVTAGYEASYNLDTLTTLTLKDGSTKGIGYYVTDNCSHKSDTLVRSDGTVIKKNFSFSVPDVLGNYKVELIAFAEGYYTSSAVMEYSIVREGLNGDASLTNFDFFDNDFTILDLRDLTSYYCTTVGDVDWMRQNVCWEGAGRPIENSEAAGHIFGRFYTHSEALEACPKDWTLPTEQDWADLAKALGKTGNKYETFPDIAGALRDRVNFNGSEMWEYWPGITPVNTSRLSMLPVGYAQISGGSYIYYDFCNYAMFWSAEETDGMASARYMYQDQPCLYYGEFPAEETALPVRCVRKAVTSH